MPDRDAWLWIAVGFLVLVVAFIVLGVVLYRLLTRETRATVRRIRALPWRVQFRLGLALLGDERIPPVVRALPVVVMLYLAMPLDLLPDFIPVIGQLDDVVVVGIAAWLAFRQIPRPILEEHIARAEAQAVVDRRTRELPE